MRRRGRRAQTRAGPASTVVTVLVVVCIAACMALPVAASDQTATGVGSGAGTSKATTTEVGAAASAAASRVLTLRDAIALALAQGPEVTASRRSMASSQASLEAARSAFGWRLTLSKPPAVQGVGLAGGLVSVGGEGWEAQAWQAGATLTASRTLESGGSISLSASYDAWGWLGSDDGAVPEPSSGDRWAYGAKFEQPMGNPIGEQAVLAKRTAQIALEQSAAALESAERAAALSAASAFYGVAKAMASVETARRTVETLSRTLAVIKEKARTGNASSIEVQDGELSLARAQLGVSAAENALVLALQTLAKALGLPMDRASSLVVECGSVDSEPHLEFLPEASESLENCTARALELRPEVTSAKLGVLSAELAVEAERAAAAVRPKAVVTWSGTSGWVVGLDATWTVLDAGAARARIAEKENRLEQARLQLDTARDSVVQDVTKCYLERKQALAALDVARKDRERAALYLKTMEARAEAGASTYLDVLKAVDDVHDSEAALADAFYDLCLAEVRMRLAVGGAPK